MFETMREIFVECVEICSQLIRTFMLCMTKIVDKNLMFYLFWHQPHYGDCSLVSMDIYVELYEANKLLA